MTLPNSYPTCPVRAYLVPPAPSSHGVRSHPPRRVVPRNRYPYYSLPTQPKGNCKTHLLRLEFSTWDLVTRPRPRTSPPFYSAVPYLPSTLRRGPVPPLHSAARPRSYPPLRTRLRCDPKWSSTSLLRREETPNNRGDFLSFYSIVIFLVTFGSIFSCTEGFDTGKSGLPLHSGRLLGDHDRGSRDGSARGLSRRTGVGTDKRLLSSCLRNLLRSLSRTPWSLQPFKTVTAGQNGDMCDAGVIRHTAGV